MQMKVNRDCGFDFQRLPIQKKWLVAPLLDRLDGCWGQQWVPTHKLQALDVPVFVDNRRQYDNTLYACLLRQERINGFNPMNEQTFSHTWRNAHTLHGGDQRLRLEQGGGGCKARSGTDDSADHPIQLTSRNPSWHATHHTPCDRRWWCLVVFNHLDFCRDAAWSAQPTVRDVAGDLHHFRP